MANEWIIESEEPSKKWILEAEEPSAPAPNAEVMRGTRPTGLTSAITTEPISEIDPSHKRPSFNTIAKASLVKDNDTKIKIFAKARGISPDRYGVKDGEIIYTDNEGVTRSESKFDIPSDKIMNFIGKTAGDPSTIGATIGTMGGVPGIVIGGLAGESARQVVASFVYDDPQTAKGNVARLSGAGILSAIDAFFAHGATKSVKSILNFGKGKGQKLKQYMRGENIDLGDAERLKSLAKDFDIDLFTSQSHKSRTLEAKQALVRELPETANTVEAKELIQQEQIQGAIPKFLDSISPQADPIPTSREFVELAEKTVKNLSKKRSAISSPLYKKAFAEGKEVNVESVVSFIDDRLVTAKGDVRNNLLKLKKTLEKPDLPKKESAGAIIDPKTDKPFIPETVTYDTSLAGLHDAKMTMDGMWKRTNKEVGAGSKIASDTQQVKGMLLDEMDSASELYASARASHALASPQVNRAQEGLLGVLAKTKESNLVGVASLMIASKKTNAPLVKSIKKEILEMPGGSDKWDKITRNYLEHVFETTKDTTNVNIGRKFADTLMKNHSQRAILKEALGPEKFANLKDFTEVLQSTGLTFGKTAKLSAAEALKDVREPSVWAKIFKPIAYPLVTWKKVVHDEAYRYSVGRDINKMADLLFDDAAAEQLKTLKTLKPGSEKLIQGLAVFMGMSLEREMGEEVKNLGYQNFPGGS